MWVQKNIERIHQTEKIRRDDGTKNEKRTIFFKFLNLKETIIILNRFRGKCCGMKVYLLTRISFEETTNVCKGLLQQTKKLSKLNC